MYCWEGHLALLSQPKDEPCDLRSLLVRRGARRLLLCQQLFRDLRLERLTQLSEPREDDPVGRARLGAHRDLDAHDRSVTGDSPDLAHDTVDVVRVLERVRGVDD